MKFIQLFINAALFAFLVNAQCDCEEQYPGECDICECDAEGYCLDDNDKGGGPDSRGPGESPTGEKEKLLQWHNDFRKKVSSGGVPGQPPTSKLRDLQWSKELEAKAQLLADACLYGYSSDRSIGENIAYTRTVEDDFKQWTDESAAYDYQSNNCRGTCRHYLQLVSAETKYVGCGVALCNNQGYYTVCNYEPKGNIDIGRPY
ncbi:hypothetical protein Aperf_G00000014169 [Anoplocephala perfoliata]